MFRITGPVCILVVGMVVTVIVFRLVLAPGDTVRGFREFFDQRAIRIALRTPISALLVIATALAFVLTIIVGVLHAFGAIELAEALAWIWIYCIQLIGIILFLQLMSWAYREIFRR